jgi:hypothetical protein
MVDDVGAPGGKGGDAFGVFGGPEGGVRDGVGKDDSRHNLLLVVQISQVLDSLHNNGLRDKKKAA